MRVRGSWWSNVTLLLLVHNSILNIDGSEISPEPVSNPKSRKAHGLVPAPFAAATTVQAENYPPTYPWPPTQPNLPPLPPDQPLEPSAPPSPPPIFCPRLPPYPGISSVQTLECDIESPQPEVCGLSIVTNRFLQLLPGQALVVSYTNLNSATSGLSRLLLGREVLDITQAPGAAPRAPRMVFVASGFCPDQPSLESCLHDSYHGVPPYRACQTVGCFGVSLVSELLDPDEYGGAFWFGHSESQGDTSLFASQIVRLASLDSGGSVLYFLASKSSLPVQLSYARSARLMYKPGNTAIARPSANVSYVNVTAEPLPSPPFSASAGPGSDGGASSQGGNGSSSGDSSGSGVGSSSSDGNSTGTEPTQAKTGQPPDANATVATGSGDGGAHSGGPGLPGTPPPPPGGAGGAGGVQVVGGLWWPAVLLLQFLAVRSLAATAAGAEGL